MGLAQRDAGACELPPLRGSAVAGGSLADFIWFRTGGPAEWLVRPADVADLSQFLAALDPAVHRGRGAGDDGGAGDAPEQSWHVVSYWSSASSASFNTSAGMRALAMTSAPAARAAATNGRAQVFS